MSNTDVGRRGAERGETRPTVDGLIIVCCLPVVVISAIVIVLGGVNLGFLIPAIVCGAMVGMLMFVSIRDRTTL